MRLKICQKFIIRKNMENNNNDVEKAYELLEQYDFSELTQENKLFILSVMSENQYTEMRAAIYKVNNLIEPDIEARIYMSQNLNQKESNKISKFLNYPVQIYKIAASIAILTAGYLLIQKSNQNSTDKLLSNYKTITVHVTDTVYRQVYDTVKIVENKVLAIDSGTNLKDKNELTDRSEEDINCDKELCPNDVAKIISLNNKNNISSDSSLNGILISLN